MADDRRLQAETAASAPPPKHTTGDDDTMPASGADRPTIPEIRPPTEERYRLGIELGRGGMGRVVEAFDTQLGRTVALKEVLPKSGASMDRRFRREVQITARLEHASIVPLYDSGVMPDGRPFYVMRRVTGRPFDELITRARSLPERIAMLPNLLSAIDAIAHAHRRGVIHRDLKPANILVGELGETVVIDWGLAKVIGEDEPDPVSGEPRIPTAADSLQTQVGSVFGTPGFMAPEQARGEELGPRGDVFALGATLYQLLVGRPPVAGKSATDVIESTLRHKIVPVATAAPGAPPELVAIVDKALAFEPKHRYPDAGGLAEDVRRFLTGQLVAAHNYTRRQRLARFARRHRAPLSVAALASVAVAALAWISVHRILVERDTARDATLEAEREKNKAVETTAVLKDQNDSLLVMRARAVVDSNPTEAVAVLKDLSPSSPHMADARAVAQAAVMRGVAWGLRADGTPAYITLDTSATKLAEITIEGVLHVWDLDTHRVIFDRRYGRDARPVWIDAGRIFILRAHEAPEILDLKSGDATKLALPPASWAIATDDGTHVAISDTEGLAILDTRTLAVTRLWPSRTIDSLAYAPDGSWVAAADASECMVFDASGKELARREGAMNLYGSRERHLAVIDVKAKVARAHELSIDESRWTEIPSDPKAIVVAAHYRGHELDLSTSAGTIGFIHGTPVREFNVGEFNGQIIPDAGPDVAIMQRSDGLLHFYNDGSEGTIVMPVAMPNVHLAGRAGKTRFVAVSAGIVLVYDLAEILPLTIPKMGLFEAVFADDDTALMWPDGDKPYRWYDLVTNAETKIEYPLQEPTEISSIDAGRVLVREQIDATRIELVLLTTGSKTGRVVAKGRHLRGRLVAGGVVFGSSDDPRVMVSLHDEPARELAKVDGGVRVVQPLDQNRFAALGGSGELVRGSVTGGNLERVHVDVNADAFIGTDRAGNVIVISGSHVSVWDTGVHEVAQLARPINNIYATAGGVIALLDDSSAVYLELGPKPVVHRLLPPSNMSPIICGDGAWIASIGNGGQVSIVEMPSMARWTLPVHYAGTQQMVAAAPEKRRLMQGALNRLEVVTLPDPPTDLGAWIDERTNAVEGPEGALGWPWQHGP